jgi:hypothetical protein
MRLQPVAYDDHLRVRAEQFIRTTYFDSYGARIARLPKRLFALVEGPGRILCAAGLRDGTEGFYSEHYLDAPIEQLVGAHVGHPVARCEIVEVTGLASRSPALSTQFMRDLIQYGDTLGFNWAFFTATSRLEKLLKRIHLPLIELGAASPVRVPSPELWGSYYDTAPRVVAIGRRDLAAFLAPHALLEVRAHA